MRWFPPSPNGKRVLRPNPAFQCGVWARVRFIGDYELAVGVKL